MEHWRTNCRQGMVKNVSTRQDSGPEPAQGILLASITLPGIFANIVALIITVRILKLKVHQLSPNVFVFGLTCIDLSAVLGISTPSLICYSADGWVGGQTLCRFQGFVALFCSLASGGIAVAMAVDRYISVSYPLWYRTKMRVSIARKIVLVVVTGAGTLSLMPVGGIGGFVKSLSGTFCTFDWFAKDLEDVVYSHVILVYSGVLIVTLVFCNVNVIVKLCKNKKRKRTLSAIFIYRDQDNFTSRKSFEWQFGRMMIVISVIFLFCWIPFTVRMICNIIGVWSSEMWDVQASRLALLNFVLDPFTYVLTRTQYRKELRDMCCKRKRQRLGSSLSVTSRRTTRTSSILQEIGAVANDKTHKTGVDIRRMGISSIGLTIDNYSDCGKVNNNVNTMTALPRHCLGNGTTIGSDWAQLTVA